MPDQVPWQPGPQMWWPESLSLVCTPGCTWARRLWDTFRALKGPHVVEFVFVLQSHTSQQLKSVAVHVSSKLFAMIFPTCNLLCPSTVSGTQEVFSWFGRAENSLLLCCLLEAVPSRPHTHLSLTCAWQKNVTDEKDFQVHKCGFNAQPVFSFVLFCFF